MTTKECCEDIGAWKLARELVTEIYKLTEQGNFAKDWGLKDQIRRSAVSIISNIVHPVEYSTAQDVLGGALEKMSVAWVNENYSFVHQWY